MNIENLLIVIHVLVAIAGLIFIHEFGHFLAARLLGVEVEEFGIGFPPRMATLFHAGGTRFSLNWLPLGGFVRPKGENDPSLPGGLAAASPCVRIAILAAGPVFNLLAAVFLFSFLFLKFGLPIPGPLRIDQVLTDSPADRAGLLPDDLIQQVNGDAVASQSALRELVEINKGYDLKFSILRQGSREDVVVKPTQDLGLAGELGIAVNASYSSRQVSTFDALYLGILGAGSQVQALVTLPARVLGGSVTPEDARLVGYKGIVDVYRGLRQTEIQAGLPADVIFLFFTASISVSLGLVNLLPIPALDGGRILLTLPEILFHRRIPRFYQAILNTGSMAALIFLMIYINLQDFINPATMP